ncbi:TPA: hypothetical protein DCZ39_08030 [Patescibacteria group bacterium]|nr:hypothetical protein [Candidatus Gracilibacteria bacterium]
MIKTKIIPLTWKEINEKKERIQMLDEIEEELHELAPLKKGVEVEICLGNSLSPVPGSGKTAHNPYIRKYGKTLVSLYNKTGHWKARLETPKNYPKPVYLYLTPQ